MIAQTNYGCSDPLCPVHHGGPAPYCPEAGYHPEPKVRIVVGTVDGDEITLTRAHLVDFLENPQGITMEELRDEPDWFKRELKFERENVLRELRYKIKEIIFSINADGEEWLRKHDVRIWIPPSYDRYIAFRPSDGASESLSLEQLLRLDAVIVEQLRASLKRENADS
jgi:hypothetical protein